MNNFSFQTECCKWPVCVHPSHRDPLRSGAVFFQKNHCHAAGWRIASAPQPSNPAFPMSKHNSLKSAATVGGKRSVLKRFERVKLLKERGEWKAGKSPIGLPKTKHEG